MERKINHILNIFTLYTDGGSCVHRKIPAQHLQSTIQWFLREQTVRSSCSAIGRFKLGLLWFLTDLSKYVNAMSNSYVVEKNRKIREYWSWTRIPQGKSAKHAYRFSSFLRYFLSLLLLTSHSSFPILGPTQLTARANAMQKGWMVNN